MPHFDIELCLFHLVAFRETCFFHAVSHFKGIQVCFACFSAAKRRKGEIEYMPGLVSIIVPD